MTCHEHTEGATAGKAGWVPRLVSQVSELVVASDVPLRVTAN